MKLEERAAGPTAWKRLERSRDVIWALTQAELRDERDLSVIGLLKWTLEPLAMLGVYMLLVAGVFRRAEADFALFMMCALVPFRFFSGAVTMSMSLVVRFGNIIGSYAIPRGVLPIVTILTEGASFAVGLVLLVPFMVYYGTVDVVAVLIWLPLMVAVLGLLTAGPVYLGAVYGLYLPDFRGAAQNLVRMSFLASTGLVALGKIPGDSLPRLFRANPLSGVFDGFRAVLIDGRGPDAGDVLYPAGVGAVLLVVGAVVYRWRERDFAKEV